MAHNPTCIDADDMARIVEGSPVTIPDAKIFVVTGVAWSEATGHTRSAIFEGPSKALTVAVAPDGRPVSVPEGLAFLHGTVVKIESTGAAGAGKGIILGYNEATLL